MEIKPGKYKHFKGGEYQVLGIAKHTETLEDLVVYKPLYDDPLAKLWVRPISMFSDTILVDGKEIQRFEIIG